VAGVTLAVRAEQGARYIRPRPHHRAFLAARGGEMSLSFVEETPPSAERGSLVFHSEEGGWRVHRHEGGWLYRFEHDGLSPSCYEAVAIDPRSGRGTMYFPRPDSGPRPPSALFHPVDEMLFQHHFARTGAFEVHSCGLVVGGRALVFCGQSGAGKTTTALLWKRHRRGTEVLSDDRIVLRFRGARAWAHGTPWHGIGRFALPTARPLAALFFLEQADETRIERLAPAAAAALLFARGFSPIWDGSAVERVLDTCERIVRQVPCHRFRFRKDGSAVKAALEAVGKT
jgi:hypothetical protein